MFIVFLVVLLVVEESYKGPRLDGDITPQFMKDMVGWFKDEKILHKKYAMKIVLETKKIFQSLLSLVNVTIPKVLCFDHS